MESSVVEIADQAMGPRAVESPAPVPLPVTPSVPTASLKRRAAAIGRVTAYAGVLATVLAFAWARSVQAAIGEKTLQLGHELAKFGDLLDGTHRVLLNGEAVYVASAVTEQTMGQVLDRFDQECRAHSGGLQAEFDHLPATVQRKLAQKAPAAWDLRLGVVREERADEASIMCLERREGTGLRDVVRRLTDFARTGDLGEVGDLRYVYARKTDGGKVHVLSTFTEGRFNLYKVIGNEGVEPGGADPAATPRPPNSTRTWSAQLQGSMFGVYLFDSTSTPEQVLQFYDESLPARGWKSLVQHSGIGAHLWEYEGVTMLVQAFRDDDGTRVTVAQGRTVAPEEP